MLDSYLRPISRIDSVTYLNLFTTTKMKNSELHSIPQTWILVHNEKSFSIFHMLRVLPLSFLSPIVDGLTYSKIVDI